MSSQVAAARLPLLKLNESEAGATAPERIVLGTMLFYLVVNRLIPDIYVLPIGISIRVHEVILAVLLVFWALWRFIEPMPMPSGTVGIFGLAVLGVLGISPFMHALGMTRFQIDGAERGLFDLFLYTGLFLAGYHLARRLKTGRKVIVWWLAITSIQALLSVWEYLTTRPIGFFASLAEAIGLQVDPNGLRGTREDLITRLGGQIRAATTAPIHIVLSAIVATGAILAAGWLISAKTRRDRVVAGLSLVSCLVALPSSNSRTGFLILGILGVLLLLSLGRYAHRYLPAAVLGIVLVGASFLVSPSTPRLLLDSLTRPSQDPNTVVRLERFSTLPELMSPRYAIGAGYQTHDVTIQLFDNGYNLGLIEFGIVGLAAVLLFFLAVLNRCRRGLKAAKSTEAVLPLAGLVAGTSLLVAMTTLDALSFDQYLPSCILMMGIGAGRSALILLRPEAVAAVRPRDPEAISVKPRFAIAAHGPEHRNVVMLRPDQRLVAGVWDSPMFRLRAIVGNAFALLVRRIKRPIDEVRVSNAPMWLVLATRPVRWLGTKVVVEVETPDLTRQPGEKAPRIWKTASRIVTEFVVPNRVVASALVDQGIPANKIRVQIHRPDMRFVKGGALGRRKKGPLRVVVHGDLSSPIDVRTAVLGVAEALRKIPIEMRLIMPASGPPHPVERLVDKLHLQDSVQILRPDRQGLAEAIIGSDVGLVLLDGEPEADFALPNALIEYAYVGLPVVCTRSSAIEDVFGEDKVRFVAPHEPIEVAQALIKLQAAGILRRNMAVLAARRLDEVLAGGSLDDS